MDFAKDPQNRIHQELNREDLVASEFRADDQVSDHVKKKTRAQ